MITSNYDNRLMQEIERTSPSLAKHLEPVYKDERKLTYELEGHGSVTMHWTSDNYGTLLNSLGIAAKTESRNFTNNPFPKHLKCKSDVRPTKEQARDLFHRIRSHEERYAVAIKTGQRN